MTDWGDYDDVVTSSSIDSIHEHPFNGREIRGAFIDALFIYRT